MKLSKSNKLSKLVTQSVTYNSITYFATAERRFVLFFVSNEVPHKYYWQYFFTYASPQQQRFQLSSWLTASAFLLFMSSHVLFVFSFIFLFFYFGRIEIRTPNTYVNEANCANDTNVHIFFLQQLTPSAHFRFAFSSVSSSFCDDMRKIMPQ